MQPTKTVEYVTVDYKGVKLTAEKMLFETLDHTDGPTAVLQVMLPSEGKLLTVRLSICDVLKLPVCSDKGEPFSYQVASRVEFVAEDLGKK